MKVLVTENELTRISKNDLIDLLRTNEKSIVFYRSNNDVDGVPCFLHKDINALSDKRYYFQSAIFSYGTTFLAPTIKHSIEAAMKAGRTIFILDKNESEQLFKTDFSQVKS